MSGITPRKLLAGLRFVRGRKRELRSKGMIAGKMDFGLCRMERDEFYVVWVANEIEFLIIRDCSCKLYLRQRMVE